MFDSLYLRNEESQVAEIWSICCPSGVQHIASEASPPSTSLWEGRPLKNRKKSKFSKIKPSLGGSGEKMFRGFSPRAGICCGGAYCLATEENRAGLHSTVSPPNGAERGPVEKFAPPPHPNLGADPQF